MQKNKLTKLKYFFICILIIFFIFILLFLKNKTKNSQTTELSKRSQEFLESQKKQPNSIWKDYDSNQNFTEITKNYKHITDCFIADLPTQITKIKIENLEQKCVLRANSIQPIGLLTISSEILSNLQSIDEYSAIKLRTSQPENYQLKEDTAETKIFYSPTEITYFYFKNQQMIIISLYDLAEVSDTARDLINDIILSVVIK